MLLFEAFCSMRRTTRWSRRHATKQGVRYRYYVSRPYIRGFARPPIGATTRVPAPELEAAVTKALKDYARRCNMSGVQADYGTNFWHASLALRSAPTSWRFGSDRPPAQGTTKQLSMSSRTRSRRC